MHLTSTLSILYALVVLSCTVATGSDGGSTDNDVVGTWRQAANPFGEPSQPIDERLVWMFEDDGTARWDRPAWDDRGTATYDTRAGRLIVTPDDDNDVGFDVAYHASSDELLFGALEPDDDGEDAIATWTGHAIRDGLRTEVTVIIRADGTVRVEYQLPDRTIERDGTWAERDGTVELVLGNDDTMRASLTLRDGFLGELHERLE